MAMHTKLSVTRKRTHLVNCPCKDLGANWAAPDVVANARCQISVAIRIGVSQQLQHTPLATSVVLANTILSAPGAHTDAGSSSLTPIPTSLGCDGNSQHTRLDRAPRPSALQNNISTQKKNTTWQAICKLHWTPIFLLVFRGGIWCAGSARRREAPEIEAGTARGGLSPDRSEDSA